MRVLLAGATGAIGRPLLARLLAEGHEVHATTRSHERAEELRVAGAKPEIVDFLKPGSADKLVARIQPEVIVDQLTSLPQHFDPREAGAKGFKENDAIRFEGTGALVRAAENHGVKRYVGQSVAFMYVPEAGTVRSEDDPLWIDAPEPFRQSVEIIALNERKITQNDKFTGVILRFGDLYGPGTWFASDGNTTKLIRERKFPLVGGGTGMASLTHVSDAAAAAAIAVERGSGIYNIVDDEPAALSDLVPYVADLLGARRPRRIPTWVARMGAGPGLIAKSTTQSGASNAKAKAELGWTPLVPSWRDGLRDELLS